MLNGNYYQMHMGYTFDFSSPFLKLNFLTTLLKHMAKQFFGCIRRKSIKCNMEIRHMFPIIHVIWQLIKIIVTKKPIYIDRILTIYVDDRSFDNFGSCRCYAIRIFIFAHAI